MNKSQTRQQITSGKVLEFPQIELGSSFEDRIKVRLQELTNLAEEIRCAAAADQITVKPSTRKALEELIVKEAALRWVARIALRSNGPIREKLWVDIEGAVTALEPVAQSVLRAGIKSRRAQNRVMVG
jgi:hypothetical protein